MGTEWQEGQCPSCKGSGHRGGAPKGSKCKVCRGLGRVMSHENIVRCPDCNGSGEGIFNGTKCDDCGGAGVLREVHYLPLE